MTSKKLGHSKKFYKNVCELGGIPYPGSDIYFNFFYGDELITIDLSACGEEKHQILGTIIANEKKRYKEEFQDEIKKLLGLNQN